MSFSLYYQLIPQESPPVASLPHQLKPILGRRWWDHDGTLRGAERAVTLTDLPYLDGLADAGISGAAELAHAVRIHGAVTAWIGEESDSPF